MSVILWIIGFAVLLIGGTLWSGYVLSVLWAWFIVTAFGAPALSVPAAIGLALIVRFMTYDSTSKKDEDDAATVLIKSLAVAFLAPLMCLAMGAVVKGYL